jgi:predicted transcriptional regulator
MNNNKAPAIIVEIREFQAKINDANERLKAVFIFIEECKQKKGHHQLINNVCKDMEVDIGNLKDFLLTTPQDIKYMMNTLEEMKIGSMPDKNADYYEKKDEISKHMNELKNVEGQIEGIEQDFQGKQGEYKELKDSFK